MKLTVTPKNLPNKRRRNTIPQQSSSTAASRTKLTVDNFTQKINDFRIARVNQTKVKLKGLDTGNQNPKVDARRHAQMWGFGVDWAKTIIMVTTQNAVWNVPRTLTDQFWARQAMFRL